MTNPVFQEPNEPDENLFPEVEEMIFADQLDEIDGPDDLDTPTEDAPYGYTVDRSTGERRPKKRPGRRKASPALPSGRTPSIEELKTQSRSKDEDVSPSTTKKRASSFSAKKPKKEPEPLPPFRAGPIAKGMNSLYRKAGKLVKMWDISVGDAIISCTYKDDEDELTVGEAWENVAKSNPRIRGFLLKMITGDAWGGLLWAHLPIALAVWFRMKSGVGQKADLTSVAMDFMQDLNPKTGQSQPSDISSMFGGMTSEDMGQMMQMAQSFMGGMVNNLPRNMNDVREPTITTFIPEDE